MGRRCRWELVRGAYLEDSCICGCHIWVRVEVSPGHHGDMHMCEKGRSVMV